MQPQPSNDIVKFHDKEDQFRTAAHAQIKIKSFTSPSKNEKITQAGHKGCKTTLLSALKNLKINYITCSFWKVNV